MSFLIKALEDNICENISVERANAISRMVEAITEFSRAAPAEPERKYNITFEIPPITPEEVFDVPEEKVVEEKPKRVVKYRWKDTPLVNNIIETAKQGYEFYWDIPEEYCVNRKTMHNFQSGIGSCLREIWPNITVSLYAEEKRINISWKEILK
jgi:hypothetical protein